MMNIIEMEVIMNEEAKAACAGTKYDYIDLTDFQSLFDLEYKIRNRRYDEETARAHFKQYFRDLVADLQYQEIQWDMEHDEENVTRCKYCANYVDGVCVADILLHIDPDVDYCSRCSRLTWHDFRKED